MQFIVLLSLTVAVFAFVRGEDECMPPHKPGEKHVHHRECCNIEKLIPDDFRARVESCHKKLPPPPRPTGPPPPPTGMKGPPPEVKKHHACLEECVFSENGLLTADKQLDKDAIMKDFVIDDGEIGPVIKSALEKCFSSYMSGVDQSLECKSGAHEFQKCFGQELFINCPKSLWTESAECTELKAKTTKCNMPVPMMGKKPPPPPPK